MDKLTTCPFCKSENIESQSWHSDSVFIQCRVCGRIQITESVLGTLQAQDIGSKLSAFTRDFTERNPETHGILVTSSNYKDIIASIPEYSPAQKQLFLLRAIERRSTYPGELIKLKEELDFPLAWAKNHIEFKFHITELDARGFITATITSSSTRVRILTEGWEYLEENARAVDLSNQAFVAMSFEKSLLPIWNDAIKPAIEDAGYKALRVDQDPHIERIDAKIISDIKDSRFIVADVTQQKQGVYFEAGFGLGLGKPVIWTVRKNDLENAHFDTRQYNHIVWETPGELKEKLFYLIAAVIGKSRIK